MRSLLRLSAGLCVLHALSGCTLPLLSQRDNESVDACFDDTDCDDGAHCNETEIGMRCVADSPGQPLELVLEVRPPQDAGFGTDVSHTVDGILLDEELQEGLKIVVPAAIEVTQGRVLWEGKEPRACAANSSIAASLTLLRLSPIEQAGGGSKTWVTEAGPRGPEFSGTLQPGDYAVHVVPDPSQGGCALPPALVPITFDGNQEVTIPLPDPQQIEVTITPPSGFSLSGWSLEVLDAERGLRLSHAAVLDDSATTVKLEFYTTDSEVSPILRLRPPADLLAPTGYWELAALVTGSPNQAAISIEDATLETVPTTFSVADAAGLPVAARVSFASVRLFKNDNSNFVFSSLSDTGDGNQGNVSLLPGTYRCVAQATDRDDLDYTVVEWTSSGEPLSITLPRKALLTGRIESSAAPLLPFTVSLEPSPEPRTSFIVKTLGSSSILPAGASVVAMSGADFSMSAEHGTFQLSVRSPIDSPIPWLVRPSFEVLGDHDLGVLSPGAPRLLTGQIEDSQGQPVTYAQVRAFVKTEAGLTMAVGEGLSSDTGVFELNLPTDLTLR